jgi:hypothetical protein
MVLDHLTKNPDKVTNPNDWFASLNFYNMEDKSKVDTVLNYFDSNKKSGSGFSTVTEIAGEIDFKEDRDRSSQYSEQLRKENNSAVVVRDFRIEFGTAFHKVVEYALDAKKANFADMETAIDKTLDAVEKYRNLWLANNDLFNELGAENK